MKRIITILLFLCTISFHAVSQITLIHQSDRAVNDLCKIGTDIYACGDGGRILKSTDKGASWKTMYKEDGVNFRAVHFADSLTGYAAGEKGLIYKTSDKGKSWKKLSSITDQQLNDVFFKDSLYGVIAGDSGTIVHTKDGGKNWEKVANLSKSNKYYSVSMTSKDSFFVVGSFTLNYYPYSAMVTSFDGGLKWTEKIGNSGKAFYNTIYFITSKVGYILVDYYGQPMLKTEDGGLTWKPINLFQDREINYKVNINFIDESIGMVCTEYASNTYFTQDGGKTWKNLGSRQLSFPKTIMTDTFQFVGIHPSRKSICNTFMQIPYKGSGKMEAPTLAGASYQWYLNNEEIIGANKENYEATTNGLYKVVVSYDSIVGSVGQRLAAGTKATAVFEYPVNDIITRNMSADFRIGEDVYNIADNTYGFRKTLSRATVYNATGIVAMELEHTSKIELNTLPEGIYILKAQYEENPNVFTFKISKK